VAASRTIESEEDEHPAAAGHTYCQRLPSVGRRGRAGRASHGEPGAGSAGRGAVGAALITTKGYFGN
jgi:hypothetical protein